VLVQHDGGWAYKVNGVFSDDKGKWHAETASGRDRPHTFVKDKG